MVVTSKYNSIFPLDHVTTSPTATATQLTHVMSIYPKIENNKIVKNKRTPIAKSLPDCELKVGPLN